MRKGSKKGDVFFCSLDECHNIYFSSGFCRKHYRLLPHVYRKEKEYQKQIRKTISEHTKQNHKESTKKWNRKLKTEVLIHYGGGVLECMCCGEKHLELLTIDHVFGGGRKHRNALKNTIGGSNFYRWLKNNSFPTGYRTLCMNCNFSYGKFGYCPHLIKGVKVRTGGFGYKRNDLGQLEYKSHMFGRKIGLDVEIGRFTNIDVGSWRDTEIQDNTKIDSLVHIGHNAVVGKNVLIVSHVTVGGSSEIGDYSYIGMGASINDRIKIGSHVLVAAGAVVTEDVPDNCVVAGIPAIIINNRITMSDEELFQMIGIYKKDLRVM